MLTTSVDGITSSLRQGVRVKGKASDDQECPKTLLDFFLWDFVKVEFMCLHFLLTCPS
ncbi:hypothetical protein C0J52_08313 [Blattella germanica]|nr:hypothetical protein C0J52_08313 [Blattella germanica]